MSLEKPWPFCSCLYVFFTVTKRPYIVNSTKLESTERLGIYHFVLDSDWYILLGSVNKYKLSIAQSITLIKNEYILRYPLPMKMFYISSHTTGVCD